MVCRKSPFTSSRQHPSIDDCLEYKRGDFVLCTTVVHSDTYTYEQFLKLTVGSGLGLLSVLLPLCSNFMCCCFCCVRFSFFTKPT